MGTSLLSASSPECVGQYEAAGLFSLVNGVRNKVNYGCEVSLLYSRGIDSFGKRSNSKEYIFTGTINYGRILSL